MTNFSFPDVATWRHHGSREGFEAVFFAERHVAGHVAGIEEGEPYGVRYEIWLDERWHTRTGAGLGTVAERPLHGGARGRRRRSLGGRR